ncbi:MAG: FAD:protein FMN transferase [Rubrivivax sp.]
MRSEAMQRLHLTFTAMGTPCEVQLAAPVAAHARAAAQRVQDEVSRLERRYSRYREDSDLSALNRVAAAGGSTTVDDETAALLDYAHTCHGQSGGLFDISSGLLRRAWRFGSGRLPDAAEVQALLPFVGWHQVRWQRPRLSFGRAGMELDLGGIVKEYAADRAAALLAADGIAHGLVNLGGDLRVVGPQPDGSPWRVGVRDPHDAQALLVTLALAQGALASSGDYERCIVVDGVRHGHILDPRSGWPVQGLAAVSVAAPLAVVAGSACTIAMLMGRDGIDWLGGTALPHLWVDAQGRRGGPLLDHPR